MFDVGERARVQERLLELAAAGPDVVGAAITGSLATGREDRWSDIDLAFGIEGDVANALERWTATLYEQLSALHHWDVLYGSSVYRVFLLPDCLEVDLSFTPAADFGPRGPRWRTVFGDTAELPASAPDRDHLVGLAWHHVLHSHAAIERGKPWQAEWFIGSLRDQILALACLRLGRPTNYARGVDLLPAEITAPLEAALVRSLDEPELRRALAAGSAELDAELERTDPDLAARLRPTLAELASRSTVTRCPDYDRR
jgi:hypothetical protein